MTRPVVMGDVVGVFGVRGWVKVRSGTRPREAILDYPVWQLDGHDRRLLDGRAHGPGLVAQLEGIDDRDAAAALVGQAIKVDRDEMPPLPDDEFYWADLIGLAVVDQHGASLGEVQELMETGAHDVLVIRGAGRQTLIPFVRGPIVTGVDLAQGRITVNWDAD